MSEPIAPTYVDLHFRRDERGRPHVFVVGFEGTGRAYRWAFLTPTGWREIERDLGSIVEAPADALLALEDMTQRVENGPPIRAPREVRDDARERLPPRGVWSDG